MLNVVELSEEVLYTGDGLANLRQEDIAFLKDKAMANRRQRVRLCAHKDVEDSLHEMLIVHAKGNYVPPHKHLKKNESFHMIEGRLKVVNFDDSGNIIGVFSMGDYSSGETFFLRNPQHCFHTVIAETDLVVFHETTNGPFRREDTVFATWAPGEDQPDAQDLYIRELTARLASDW